MRDYPTLNTDAENLQLLTSTHLLDDYAVFDIEHQISDSIYPKVSFTGLTDDLIDRIMTLEGLNNVSIFRMLSVTSLPFRWLVGIDTITETRLGRTIADEAFDQLLDEQDIVGGYCVCAQTPGKRRGVVVYFKKRQKPKIRYPDLVLDTLELYERELAVAVLEKNEGLTPLSASERRCLVWCACGKTSGEIGEIL
ncbi:MAG: hypothetical protein GKR97_19270 [Rhizobiaceae bacterium]|nr:hypothetical protein [Rhizobiaceae bacterium]